MSVVCGIDRFGDHFSNNHQETGPPQESWIWSGAPTLSSQEKNRMEMWKMLTKKFKAHTLDEELPFHNEEVDDRDSGTESDEENAELQAIEEAMQSNNNTSDQENLPQVLTSSGGFMMTGSPGGGFMMTGSSGGGFMMTSSSGGGYHMMTGSPSIQVPIHSASSPVNSVSKRPFQLVNQPSIPFQPLSHNTGFINSNTHLEMESPQENSDYERCSLDYEPMSSTEFERHSSEEELAIINCTNRELHPEKRKWSQVNRCNSCNDSSGSSDDEVRDLLGQPRPLNFSSSPPKGVQRLSQTLSPKLFLANLSPNNVRLCSVSPRKRHRQISSSDVSDATVMQRPCLDFEKMQKTLFRKHLPHGIAKARIVKIRVGLLKGAM